ncbi:hypothetical protein [Geminisphaera colitermitum]|uniref:hypothetical protein n=1 Tax=Geminisphaera colitermitum TaxID=1148786 RepID=UPI0001965562|nr:hypothetical protein [Geminisphaera colitermitum]
MRVKTNAILHLTTAVDYAGKEGYFVNADGAFPAAAADTPLGVIAEPWDDQSADIAIGGAASGTYLVKLGAAPGAVIRGTFLQLEAGGTVKADTGAGARTLVARALQAGVAGDLIEAVIIAPQTIPAA